MTKIITPTVGRKVWYRPSAEDVAAPRASASDPLAQRSPMVVMDQGQPFDATVLRVHGDRCVGLWIVDHSGRYHVRSSVYMAQPGDDRPSGGFAEWMPDQVGQAERASRPAEADKATTSRADPALTAPRVALQARRVRVADIDGENGGVVFRDVVEVIAVMDGRPVANLLVDR